MLTLTDKISFKLLGAYEAKCDPDPLSIRYPLLNSKYPEYLKGINPETSWI